MHDRVVDVVHDRLVDLGILANQHKLGVFIQTLAHIAHDAAHFLEHARNRNHPDGHNDLLQLVRQLAQLARSLGVAVIHPAVIGLHGMRGRYHRFRNDNLPHKVHQIVELRQVDIDEILLDGQMISVSVVRGRLVACSRLFLFGIFRLFLLLRQRRKNGIIFGVHKVFDALERGLHFLFCLEQNQKPISSDHIRCAGVGIQLLRHAAYRNAVFGNGVHQKHGAQMDHLCFFFKEHAHREGVFLPAGGGLAHLHGRGRNRGHGSRSGGRLCGRLLRRGAWLRLRGCFGFFRGLSGNLFEERINFFLQTADICNKRFVIFDFLNFRFQKIAGFEHQVRERLVVLRRNAVFSYIIEQVFHLMGHRSHAVELHHCRRTLDRVHDAKDLVDTVRIKIARLLAAKEDFI